MRVTGDVVDGFFYDLLRDHLPAGTLEKVLQEAEKFAHEEMDFTNSHLASYAKEIRTRLQALSRREEPKSPLLDIDDLRARCTKIHFFGLGFVQLKTGENTRYHFYHPALEAFTENPHDHRYSFTSEVLRGSLENMIWDTLGGYGAVSATLRQESCTPDVTVGACTPCLVDAKMVSVFRVSAGSSYYIDSNTFHQVKRVGSEPCVTHLRRGPKVKQFSSVISLAGATDICPFSRDLEEVELWDIVRDCIL